MKNRKHFWQILFCLMIAGYAAHAQSAYSYFYFEGDQQTPFYVKVEGKMQPRLGKNHFIIPNLDAGYTHFQILFQKNEFPPQDFLLEVPKGGSRGFVLHKVNERQFALYDLQQKRYIVSGNKQEDDHAPIASSIVTSDSENGDGQLDSDNEIPAFAPNKEKDRIQQQEDRVPVPTDNSRFLNGIELNSDGSATTTSEVSKKVPAASTTVVARKKKRKVTDLENLPAIKDPAEKDPESHETTVTSELPPVPNTDCPTAMSNEEFEEFALRVLDRSTDDERLKFIKKSKDRHCFSTEQVRILANNLNGQSARYEMVKILYFHTSDQENYKRLEALFNTDFLRSKFREIINPE